MLRVRDDRPRSRSGALWPKTRARIDELLYLARHLDRIYQQVDSLGVGVDLKTDEHPLSDPPRFRGGRAQSWRGRQNRLSGHELSISHGSAYPDRTHHDLLPLEPGIQKVIESDGTTVITTQRVLYCSPNWNRSWEYSKAAGIFHSDSVSQGWGASYVGVSNRARISGFTYRSGFARSVRDRLVLALAVADGTLEDMVLALKAERSELDRS